MPTDLTNLCVALETSLQEVIALMEAGRIGIVLVVDAEGRLLGTITDGDIRRALLAGVDFNLSVDTILAQKKGSEFEQPITARADEDREALLAILQRHSILHLPLLDQDQRVVAVTTLHDLVPEQASSVRAVVMAGGFGKRLRPLTDDLPKPMLPVGDRPLMETIIEQLRATGIQHVNIAVHHLPERIAEHFGDGRDFGVEITYVSEDLPLGTAGALGLMDPPAETLLVMNGDILTQVDFRRMVEYHREQGADLTVAVQKHEVRVPYGVIEYEGTLVRRLNEKPLLKFFINAGIYLLEPAVHSFIPRGEPCDMTDLIQRLLGEGKEVAAFPIHEYWMDIGLPADYQQVQSDVRSKEGKE